VSTFEQAHIWESNAIELLRSVNREDALAQTDVLTSISMALIAISQRLVIIAETQLT